MAIGNLETMLVGNLILTGFLLALLLVLLAISGKPSRKRVKEDITKIKNQVNEQS